MNLEMLLLEGAHTCIIRFDHDIFTEEMIDGYERFVLNHKPDIKCTRTSDVIENATHLIFSHDMTLARELYEYHKTVDFNHIIDGSITIRKNYEMLIKSFNKKESEQDLFYYLNQCKLINCDMGYAAKFYSYVAKKWNDENLVRLNVTESYLKHI